MPVAVGVMADSYNKPAAATGPPVTSGLSGWYDASQLAGANGSPVTSWPDLSGFGRTLTGPGPTLTTNGLNGKTIITFTNEPTLDNSLAAATEAAFQHFFVVAKYDPATFIGYDGLLSAATTDDPFYLIGGQGSTTFYEPPVTGYHKDGVSYALPFPAPMQAWAVMSVSATTWGTFALMVGMDRGIYGRFWHGGVAEIIGYNRVLSTVERQQVETYLKGKWGTP